MSPRVRVPRLRPASASASRACVRVRVCVCVRVRVRVRVRVCVCVFCVRAYSSALTTTNLLLSAFVVSSLYCVPFTSDLSPPIRECSVTKYITFVPLSR